MNIQIFGKNKCFDTKKAERYFKERGIPVQRIDILEKGLSRRELESVERALGGIDAIIDEKSKYYCEYKYLPRALQPAKLAECPLLYKTPIVRNGGKATVGYCPDVWKSWEQKSEKKK